MKYPPRPLLWGFAILFLLFSFACSGKQYISKRQGEGDGFLASRNYAAAVAAYEKAAAEAHGEGDAKDEAHLRSLLGWAYAGAGEMEAAGRESRAAVAIAEANGLPAAPLYARKAAIDSRSGNFEEGLAAADKALSLEAERWRAAGAGGDRDAIIDHAVENHGLPPDVDMIRTVTLAETARTVILYLIGDHEAGAESGERAVRHFEQVAGLMKMAPNHEAREFFIGEGVAAGTASAAFLALGDTEKAEDMEDLAVDAFGKAGVIVKSGGLLAAYAEAGGYRAYRMKSAEPKPASRFSRSYQEAMDHYAAGRYRQAETGFRAALADAEKEQRTEEVAQALSQLGWIAAEFGRYPEAVRLMERSMKVDGRADNAAVTKARLSTIYARMGNYDAGLKAADEAFEILFRSRGKVFAGKHGEAEIDAAMKKPGLPPDMILIKSVTAAEAGRATNLYFMEDLGAAISAGERAIGHFKDVEKAVNLADAAERASWNEGIAYTLLITGDAYLRTGHPRKGRDLLKGSRPHFAAARLVYGDIAAEGLIGYSHALEGDYEQAAALYKNAMARAEAAKLEDLQWHMRSVLGAMLHEEAVRLDAGAARIAGDVEGHMEDCMELQLAAIKRFSGMDQALNAVGGNGQAVGGLVERINRTGDCKAALPLLGGLALILKEDALAAYQGALENLKAIASRLDAGADRRLFLVNKKNIFEAYLRLLSELKGAGAVDAARERFSE